jgi:transcriptional regulator MraZ
MADDANQGAVPEEPPRGTYPARLDEKGRLKLPEKFQKYLAGLPEKKLFVTSKDRIMATVYPIAIWRENEKLRASYREKPNALKRVWFTTQDLGSEAEMDGQGRVQFSTDLRRELGIENQPVRVLVVNGAIEVMSEERFQAKRAEAARSSEDDLEILEQAGFK